MATSPDQAAAKPDLDYAFRIRIEIGAPMDIGVVDGNRQRVMPIVGGSLEGDRLTGQIIAGGADWQVVNQDGVATIYARYQASTPHGIIMVEDRGVRHGPAEVMQRLARGEPVDPALYYFRTTPRFTASAPALAWLTRTAFIAKGRREPTGVYFDVFAVG